MKEKKVIAFLIVTYYHASTNMVTIAAIFLLTNQEDFAKKPP